MKATSQSTIHLISVAAMGASLLFAGISQADVTCVTAPAAQVSWWRAEGNAVDSVGTNNGVIVGTTFAPGEVGQAFKFNGIGNTVRIPASPTLDVGRGSGF